MMGYIGLIALLCLSATSYAALPKLERCPTTLKKDDYNRCVVKEITKMTPYLKIGIPEMDVPPMDPFKGIPLSTTRTFAGISGTGTFKNYTINGFMNYTIKEIDVDPDNLKASIRFHVPRLQISGEYEVRGSLFHLPINIVGSGDEYIYGVDLWANVTAKEVIDESGVKRFKIEDLKLKIYLDHGSVTLTANFPYFLNAKAAQLLFNQFSGRIYKTLNDAIVGYFTPLSRRMVDKALKKFSVDDLTVK